MLYLQFTDFVRYFFTPKNVFYPENFIANYDSWESVWQFYHPSITMYDTFLFICFSQALL